MTDRKHTQSPQSHPVDVHVGQRIRHFRWLISMTQQQLAEKVGIKFQQIQKYETGANRVSASRLYNIAAVLEQPLVDFFPAEGKKMGIGPDLTHQEAKILQSFRNATPELKSVMIAAANAHTQAVA